MLSLKKIIDFIANACYYFIGTFGVDGWEAG